MATATLGGRWITPPPIIQPRPKWFTRPLMILVAVLPLLIGLFVPGNLLLGCMMAYVNVVIITTAMVKFSQMRSLQSVLHILFLTWLLAAWPLGSLYLSMAYPDSWYQTINQQRRHLSGIERVQFATLLFLLTYIPITLAIARRSKPFELPTPATATDRRTANIMLFTVMSIILLNATSKVAKYPAPIQYIADGGYNYLHSLMLLVGALFPRLPFYTRALALAFMGAAGGFYIIGNSRGMAVLPFMLFLTGLLFFSEMKPKIKMSIIVIGAVVMPLVLATSDITRDLTKTGGFGNLEARIAALGRIGEYVQNTPLFARSFQRTFFTAGHSMITLMPDRYAFVDFSLPRYAIEFVMRLIPGKIYYEPFYSTTARLKAYDFMITDKTSVELSFIGSLYMLGGFIPIVIGTAFIALVHGWFGRWVSRAQSVSPYKGLFYCGMLAQTFLWGQNLDPISHFRILFWQAIAAAVLYYVLVRIFVGERRTTPAGLPQRMPVRSVGHPATRPA